MQFTHHWEIGWTTKHFPAIVYIFFTSVGTDYYWFSKRITCYIDNQIGFSMEMILIGGGEGGLGCTTGSYIRNLYDFGGP